jgi:hypothetical protein
MNIFEKDIFTLKELCKLFINNEFNYNYKDLFIISNCYINFSSNNDEYKKYLKETRLTKGFLYQIQNEIRDYKINFREILQFFDINFNKLVIKINIEKNDYDINMSWKIIENNINGFNKEEFKNFYVKCLLDCNIE